MKETPLENENNTPESPTFDYRKDFKIACFDLPVNDFPPPVQFTILTILTLVFCLITAYMQELIFQLDGFKAFGMYLTLIQFVCFTISGFIEHQFNSDKTRRIPFKTYGAIAFLTVSTMGLSHTSVAYLNYPTKVMFKCCKLIPVMIGGILIQGRKYNCIEVCAVLCMCIGLTSFVLADNSVSPNFNSYGIIIICLALISDGVIANVQEKTLKQYSASKSEIILYSYSIGCMYILVILFTSGNFFPAYQFCKKYPVETYGYGALYSLFAYLGVNTVLSLIGNYGAVVAVTVTTCRKAITIILSFTFFSKPFIGQYVWSGLIVVLGIYLNVYSKNKEVCDSFLSKKIDNIKVGIGWEKSHDKNSATNLV